MNKISDEYYLKKTDECIESEEYDEAYLFCNADLTKYLIGIKRHTEPLLKANSKAVEELYEIDLKALEEIFNKLSYIMYHGNIKVNINEKFSRIETLIDNKKYFELIRFYRILLMKIFENDADKIRDLLLDLDYKQFQRVELLEFYYHEITTDFEYSKKIEILSRLISNEPLIIHKIKYNMTLAIKYFMNGELESSVDTTKITLRLIEEIKDTNLDEYELEILAGTYFYCGLILEEHLYYKLGIDTYNKLIAIINTNDMDSISHVYLEIGECYLMDKEYIKSIDAFKKSLTYQFSYLAHINIARANIELNKINEASNEIYDLKMDSIPDENVLDYLITIGRILIRNNDINKAKEIYDILKEFKIEEVLFNDYRNDILINLLEQYKGFYVEKNPSKLRKALDEINNTIDLKPNIMGIGININYVISKILKKK
jgi:hypothetical protein